MLENLRRHGYAFIPRPKDMQDIELALALFEDIITVPPPTPYRFVHAGWPPDTGLSERSPEIHPASDHKKVFHWRPYYNRLLFENNLLAFCHRPFVRLLQWSDHLYKASKRTVLECLHELSRAFPEVELRSWRIEEHPDSVLRFVRYTAATSREGGYATLGREHHDFSFLTLIIGEDCPGLEIHTEGDWQTISPTREKVILIAGEKLSQYTNGKIPAARHRVRQKITDPQQTVGRRSLLFFLNSDHDQT